MPRLFSLLAAILTACFCLPAIVLAQVPPERKAPAIYHEAIAPLLTPLSEVLVGRTHHPDSKENGLSLLAEVIHYRSEDGTDYRVYHDVYYARTDGAVDALGSNTYRYDRTRESLFLIEAATIQADDTRLEIDPRGAFLQAPQHEAANSLYTSEEELTVVFPVVAAGATTETIVLIREDKPVFPGEFATSMAFRSGWERYRTRLVLDWPNTDLARLQALSAHPDVPEPKEQSDYTPGRTRRSWSRGVSPESEWEEGAPAFRFRAPTLWLTTLDTWDKVAAWIDDLLRDRSEIGPDLTALLDTWTADAENNDEVIRRVFDRVANDVRYTGLEFGLAGYQPYACAEVWANRYGDCKDKANLLRALLAAKGIESHLVLLQTRSHGKIEQRSPSWRQFNHAILAVPRDDGSHWFLDPTVEQLNPAHLPFSDASRDVLIVHGNQAVWAGTPASKGNRISVTADLILDPQGEVRGWMNLNAEGADAAYYATYYNDRDPQSRLSRYDDDIRAFFPGSKTIDLDYTPTLGAVDRFGIRGYFLRTTRSNDTISLNFPFPVGWLPDLNTSGDRKHPYRSSERIEDVEVKFNLPEGAQPVRLPAAFEVATDTVAMRAGWTVESGVLTASLRWSPVKTTMSPAEYGVFQRAVRSLTAWLEQTVEISRESLHATKATSTSDDAPRLDDFPLLATGAGQMRLLADRYPEGRDNARRRLALQRILQWFPDDIEIAFDATIYLALLDADGEWNQSFIDRLSALHTRFGDRAPASSVNWARYLIARTRWTHDKDPAGIAELVAIAANPDADSYRRGWSAYFAGIYQAETDQAKAREIFTRFEELDTSARTDSINYHARLLAQQPDATLTHMWLESLRTRLGAEFLASTLDGVFAYVAKWVPAEHHDDLVRFTAAAEPFLGDIDASTQTPPAGLADLRRRLQTVEAWAGFFEAINHLVANHADRSWLAPGDADTWVDLEAVRAELERANDAHEGTAVINAALNLAMYHHDDKTHVADYLRWALWWLRKDRIDDAFLFALGDAALRMPASPEIEEVVNAWRQFGTGLREIGEADRAITLYQTVAREPGCKPYQTVDAHAQLSQIAIEQNRIDDALEHVRQLSPQQALNTRGGDFLFPGITISIARGDFDQALAWIEEVRAIDKKYFDELEHALVYNAVLPLVSEHQDALRAYWSWGQGLHDSWSTLIADLGGTPEFPPEARDFADIATLNKDLKEAIESGDHAAYLAKLDTALGILQIAPGGTSDLIEGIEMSAAQAPDLNRRLRTWFLDAIRTMPPTETVADKLMTRRTGLLLSQLERYDEIPAWVDETLERWGEESPEVHYAAFVWIDSTGKTPTETASVDFARRILQQEDVQFRDSIVGHLHDRYLALGHNQARLDLIVRELESPSIQANTRLVEILQKQREFLQGLISQGEAITTWVDEWIKRNDYGWIDLLSPASLDEPGLPSPNSSGYYGWGDIDYARALKLNALIARSPDRPATIRMAAYRMMVMLLVAFDNAPSATQTIASALTTELWPTQERVALVSYSNARLSGAGHSALARQITSHPSNKDLPARFLELVRVPQDAGDLLAKRTPEDLADAFRTIIGKPLEEGEPEIAQTLLIRLVLLDQDPLVDALLTAARDLETGSTVANKPTAIRLQWTRAVRGARAERPFFHTVRDRLHAIYPTGPADQENLSRMIGILSFSKLTHAERVRAVAVSLDEAILAGIEPAELLSVLASAHYLNVEQPSLAIPFIDVLLNSEIEDSRRAEFLGSLHTLIDVDIDEPYLECDRRLRAFLDQSNRGTLPLTRTAARRLLAVHALRRAVDDLPPELFAPAARQELGEAATDALQLQFLVSRGRHHEAMAVVQRMSPDDLTTLRTYPAVEQVLRHENALDELELMREVATDGFTRKLNDVLAIPDIGDLYALFECASALDRASDFTDPFWDRVLGATPDPDEQTYLKINRYIFAKEWEKVITLTDAFIERQPESYATFGDRGEAHYHLGNYRQAAADLRRFMARDTTSLSREARAAMLADAESRL